VPLRTGRKARALERKNLIAERRDFEQHALRRAMRIAKTYGTPLADALEAARKSLRPQSKRLRRAKTQARKLALAAGVPQKTMKKHIRNAKQVAKQIAGGQLTKTAIVKATAKAVAKKGERGRPGRGVSLRRLLNDPARSASASLTPVSLAKLGTPVAKAGVADAGAFQATVLCNAPACSGSSPIAGAVQPHIVDSLSAGPPPPAVPFGQTGESGLPLCLPLTVPSGRCTLTRLPVGAAGRVLRTPFRTEGLTASPEATWRVKLI
jgi:hypothetical protein